MVRKRTRAVGLVLTGLLALGTCKSPSAPTGGPAIFQIRACRGSRDAPAGEVFRILVNDPTLVAKARSLIGAPYRSVLAGMLVPGDGGFNAPWGWHLDPASISFPQSTIELCDGCPSFIQDGQLFGQTYFCPWSSEIIAEER